MKKLVLVFLCAATSAHAQVSSWPTLCGGQIAVSPADVIYVSTGTGMCRYTTSGTSIPTDPSFANFPYQSVSGLAISNDGYVWIAMEYVLHRYSLDGDQLTVIVLPRHGGNGFPATAGVAADDQYVYVQVNDQNYLHIDVYAHDGTFVRDLPEGRGAGLAFHDGYLYACDQTANAVLVRTTDGAIVRTIGQGELMSPEGVAVSGSNVYVLDNLFEPGHEPRTRVRAYATTGVHLGDFDVPLDSGRGIAVDSGGNVYVVGVAGGSPYVHKYAPVGPVPTTSSTWGGLKAKYR